MYKFLQFEKASLLSRILLILLSTFLFALSMPGSLFPMLTWIAFAPIMMAIKGANPKQSAWLFFGVATACILVVIWWFVSAVINFTNLNSYLALIVLLVFAMIIAIPYAVIGWVVAYKNWSDSGLGLFFTCCCFVCLVMFYPTPLPGTYAQSLYSLPYSYKCSILVAFPYFCLSSWQLTF